MTLEEQLYLETDKFLQALADWKKQEEAEKVFSSFEMRESAIGLLCKDEAIQNMSGYIITQYGRSILKEGGYYGRYLRQKRNRIATIIAAICSAFAAAISLASFVITLVD